MSYAVFVVLNSDAYIGLCIDNVDNIVPCNNNVRLSALLNAA